MKLDINIGDILLGGRFKNKRIEVKKLGRDELGQPTFNNDRKLLAVRIEKKLPEENKSSKTREENMEKESALVYELSFKDEILKTAGANEDMAEAFYQAQKRINKEQSRKKLIGLTAGTAGTYGIYEGVRQLHKRGYTGKAGRKIDNFLKARASEIGNRAGVYSGLATNAAAEGYKNTLKAGASEWADKVRGGGILKKLIKKTIFKGR